MSVSGVAGRLGVGEIAQARRWARRVGAAAADEELRSAARAVVRLADEAERLRRPGGEDGWDWSDGSGAADGAPTLEDVLRARAWAEPVASNGASPELKAAAKAVLLLCDDVASFHAEWDWHAAPSPDAAGERPPGGPPPLRLALERWRGAHPLGVLSTILPLALFLLLLVAARAAAPDLEPRGPAGGALVGARALRSLELSIAGGASRAVDARWSLDGENVTGRARIEAGRIVLRPRQLVDGEHSVEVRFSGLAPWSPGSVRWSFTVDATPPEIRVTRASLEAVARSAYRLQGDAGDAVSVTVGGKAVELADGRFSAAYAGPPAGELRIVARDAAGNARYGAVKVAVVPRRPAEPVRAVHVTADAWANEQLRAGVLALLDAGKVNAVELDLKDESGVIGWNAPVPLGRRIGAVRDIYDLKAAVQQLHAKGARVIGRLVAFRDPILARAAWKSGDRGEVIQAPGGGPYSGYGGFTNFADATVRAYNVDVAVAAAKLGVDDVLYDYVRRPDGPLDTMVFPGLEGDPTEPIASFLAESRKALRPYGTFLGASVFGIAATRPDEIAQDVPLMAREVDYIAPMLYPSHWGPYEYEIPNPNLQPYDIVYRSLQDFEAAVKGTGARLVPWLQDFSLGAQYGPAEVRAQIQAARDAGVDEFLLWDPEVTYTAGALKATAKRPATGAAKAPAGSSALVTLPSLAAGEVDSGLAPDELGVVPVLMYHQVVPGGGSEYDLTPAEFRAELERLYDEGYRPITASDYVNGTIDLPRGATPVVMTFDDGTSSQARLLADGTIDPETAVGIMLDFARTHPGFEPAGTFYVNRDPFVAGGRTGQLLAWLAGHGFEIGNHTRDHVNLSGLTPAGVQKQFVLDSRMIHEYLPGAAVTTMALPFGVMPKRAGLARKGSWDGERYDFRGVMLVGAEPAPSPFAAAFDRGAIPRIRSFPTADLENGSADWLDRLARDPELRYVSDGNPARVTFPAARAGDLAEAFRARAKPY